MSKKYYSLILDGRPCTIQNVLTHNVETFRAYYYNYYIEIMLYPNSHSISVIAPAGKHLKDYASKGKPHIDLDTAIEQCVGIILNDYNSNADGSHKN